MEDYIFSLRLEHLATTAMTAGMHRCPLIQGGPKWNGILSTIYDAKLVSMYGVTSPDKNDTKISHFGSLVCFLEHSL